MSPRSDKSPDAKPSDDEPKKRRFRGAFGRNMMKVPVLRRWYIRRILKFIDKSKAKGRRLPENMVETARFLSRVPEKDRAQAMEDAMLAQQDVPEMSREFRRAAQRQRKSGASDQRYRPGRPPGAPRPRSRPR